MKATPPEHLDPTAVAKWRELAPMLDTAQPGVADALAAYCMAWSRWTAAEGKVSELGAVVKSAAGFAMANPYVAIAAAASRQLRQWAAELQITPKTRDRKQEGGEVSAVELLLAEDENSGTAAKEKS